MRKINCSYAKFSAWNGNEPVYECRNPAARPYHQSISDGTCAGCADRIPLQLHMPAVIRREDTDKQITIKEWARETA